MAVTVAECEQMIAACKSANVKLMIAYRMHYEPYTLKTIELIKSGALGKVQAIDSANGFNIAHGEWRTQRALAGGGPLMDVGIYCLNATRYLTGEEPVAFTAVATSNRNDERFKDIEENLSWTMRFPSGTVASCSTTYGGQMPSYAKVFGENGWLEFDNFNYEGQRLTAMYRKDRGSPATKLDEASTLHDPSQFVDQVNHFTSCVLENKTPGTPGEEGLKDMRYIESIYKAAGLTLG
jgi:predicted dehydrogenase